MTRRVLNALRSPFGRAGARSCCLLILLGLVTGCGDRNGPPAATVAPNPGNPTNVALTPLPRVQATASARPSPGASPANDQRTAAFERLLNGEQGVYGVLMMEQNGTIDYSRNADTPFIAASLYKLVLLADFYQARENGAINFDRVVALQPAFFPVPGDLPDSRFAPDQAGQSVSIRELLLDAGAWSSNVAAKALLTLTDTVSLQRVAQQLGLHDTHLFVDPATLPHWPTAAGTDAPPGNHQEAIAFITTSAKDESVSITTPRDMATYFLLLLQGRVVNQKVSAEILAILEQQQIDRGFPQLLPSATHMAHKTGTLDHVVHDVGFIDAPAGRVILAAMSEDQPDDDRATQIIQRLALIAYGTYDIPPFTAQAVPDEGMPTDQTGGAGVDVTPTVDEFAPLSGGGQAPEFPNNAGGP